MLEGIFYTILLFLILIGIFSIVNYFFLRVLMPKKGGKYILLVSPDVSGSDVAGLVYLLSINHGFLGGFRNIKVTVVDCGMCETAAEMCKILCDERENVEMCNCDEICEFIKHSQLPKEKN